jgi:nucleotide-binding universal stress UspA family protein
MKRENLQPHVLIALNYNPATEKIAEQGYEIARNMGARVTLLHVLSEPSFYSSAEYSPIMGFTGYMDMSTWVQENNEQLIAESQRFLIHIKDHLEDPAIQILVREGNFADTILETATEIKASCIILGFHQHQISAFQLSENVVEKVLNNSTIPLILIPSIATEKEEESAVR